MVPRNISFFPFSFCSSGSNKVSGTSPEEGHYRFFLYLLFLLPCRFVFFDFLVFGLSLVSLFYNIRLCRACRMFVPSMATRRCLVYPHGTPCTLAYAATYLCAEVLLPKSLYLRARRIAESAHGKHTLGRESKDSENGSM